MARPRPPQWTLAIDLRRFPGSPKHRNYCLGPPRSPTVGLRANSLSANRPIHWRLGHDRPDKNERPANRAPEQPLEQAGRRVSQFSPYRIRTVHLRRTDRTARIVQKSTAARDCADFRQLQRGIRPPRTRQRPYAAVRRTLQDARSACPLRRKWPPRMLRQPQRAVRSEFHLRQQICPALESLSKLKTGSPIF